MDAEHPFAVHFRNDGPQTLDRQGVYEHALGLATLIEDIIERADARFFIKDLLDKSVTAIVLHVAQAGGEIEKDERRRHYRVARRGATDVAAMLDLLARRPKADATLLGPAKEAVGTLVSRLAHLAVK